MFKLTEKRNFLQIKTADVGKNNFGKIYNKDSFMANLKGKKQRYNLVQDLVTHLFKLINTLPSLDTLIDQTLSNLNPSYLEHAENYSVYTLITTIHSQS